MRKYAFPRRALALLVLAAAVLVTPAVLFAHARLLRSAPAAGKTLDAPPTDLTLWFSEKPELRFTTIQLTDSAGTDVALDSAVSVAGMGVRIPIPHPIANGRYTVKWRTAASDGHPSSGTFTFIVNAPVAAPRADSAAPLPVQAPAASPAASPAAPKPRANAPIGLVPDATFSTAMRWAELVALMTLIGVVIVRLSVIPTAKWDGDLLTEVNDRSLRLGRAVLLLFALATLTRGFAQAELFPSVSGSRVTSLFLLVAHSRWGVAWAIGVGGAIVAVVGLFMASRALAGWVVTAVGIVAICISEALTGHAGAVSMYALGVASDVAHVLGAGGWLGGLTALLLCALPATKRLDPAAEADAGGRLLRAYHGAATECVTIVVASALLSSWVRFPTLDALWTTSYGQMLLRKLFFVALVAGMGLYHWRRIVVPAWNDDTRFRFQRTAVAELVFGAVVVAITALLISLPLP